MLDRAKGERDPARIVAALRKRWWLIVLIGVIAGAGAYYLSSRKPKQYRASSALLFENSHLDEQLFGNVVLSNTDPTREANTDSTLVGLPAISDLVAAQLHIAASRVRHDVSVGSDATSDVLGVSATDERPAVAAAIANAYVQQYINFRQSTDRNQLSQAQQLVGNALAKIPAASQSKPAAQELQTKSLELKLLASLQTGNAAVVQTAQPPRSPVSPTPSRDGIIGLVLGLLLGGALVIVVERGDRRIKSVAEVEEIYGVPILGTIHESSELRGAGAAGSPRDREAFSMLRAQLRYFGVDRGVKRVMITSADTREGKSVISLNLVRAAAQADEKRPLLIETDLRRPSLTAMMGFDRVAGLAELLSHTQDLASGLRELVITMPDPNGSGDAGFDVLLGGALPPNPVELLASRRMTELLAYADTMYSSVVIDTPPVGVVSDAIPLIHQVDGVIVISRIGYSRHDRASRLMKQLRGLNANVLGVVVNSEKSQAGYYGGYDAYTETPPKRSKLQRRAAKVEQR
jgi:capsular exopolysaccharide synthesis family protein